MSGKQDKPENKKIKPGEVVADKEYEIEIEEPAKDVFQITLANDAARRALAAGQRAHPEDAVTILVRALDATLCVIDAELTGIDGPWWGEPEVSGHNDGTPHRFRVQVNKARKRQLITQCARISGIGKHEAVRRLTATALRLVIFENGEPMDPNLHPMLAGKTSSTVH